MASWASDELSTLDLGDRRRNARAIGLVEMIAERPCGSIPKMCPSHAEAKAAYRFLSSEDVEPEKLYTALRASAVDRVEESGLVLAIQDTTEFNFTHHPGTAGTGPLSGPGQVGFLAHTVLLVSGEGIPLGVLGQKVWEREEKSGATKEDHKKLPIEEKESYRWVESLKATHEAIPSGPTVVNVADREADIFEVFAQERPANSELLIRACRNRRRLQGEGTMAWEAAQSGRLKGHLTIPFRRRPDRKARDATLEIRFDEFTLRPPTKGVHSPDLQPVTVNAVAVAEPSPPDGEEPVEWVLLTTLPVRNVKEAKEIVRLYNLRWLVERFHYVLKSGCQIEQSQVRVVDRLQRLLALFCVVAWRLLWMTYAARQSPDAPCTVAFTELEWQTIHRIYHPDEPLPEQPPSLNETVRSVARMGGFLARRSDGEPGVKAIWTGLKRLCDIVIGVTLTHPPLVGNA